MVDLILDNGEVVEYSSEKITESVEPTSSASPWDDAHEFLDKRLAEGEKPVYIEPDIESTLYGGSDEELAPRVRLTEEEGGYLRRFPQPQEEEDNFIWHLKSNFSQLKDARERVQHGGSASIKIAIIDTGYQEGHPALPSNHTRGISYVKGEGKGPAIDRRSGRRIEQDGHGTATMAILGGKYVNHAATGDRYEGVFGAIPFAEIVPIRIHESVALLRVKAFEKAVDYAIQQGCEVISMSMAGMPSKAWARAVNKAYLNGVVVVTAAGNNWDGGWGVLAPKTVLYPARWERVIAATGAAYDHKPYVFKIRPELEALEGDYMQGSYGPARAMKAAIAAYTPNVSWATLNNNGRYFDLGGGGTSSATPQVAATAALWICRHRQALDAMLAEHPHEKWRKVEAVKAALKESANKDYPEYEKFYGYGIIRANDALNVSPSNVGLTKAKKAKVFLLGIAELLGLYLIRHEIAPDPQQEVREEMFATEILQQMHDNESLHPLLEYDEEESWKEEDIALLREELLKSNISTKLREVLEG